MKKLIAILLIAMLAFNWYGYELLMNYLQHRSDHQLEAKLDAGEYDQQQLIELSVALDLPYTTDWENFERVDGDVVIDGIHYKYVERKYEQGRMIYKCIPNSDKARLQNARDAFFQLAYDMQRSSESKQPANNAPAFKKIISDYEQLIATDPFRMVTIRSVVLFIHPDEACSAGHLNLLIQPPEAS